MSDQDEISRLLAEANAQSEATPAPESSAPEPSPTAPRKQPPKIVGRNNDILGIAWFNGSLHAASFRRQKMTRSWSSPTPVRSISEFEGVIDEALAKLEFEGTEMFLLLENELFTHQTESLPSFSPAAARTYLKGRIQRHEQEHGRALWVAQPTAAGKEGNAILLHLLPASFYDDLNRVLLTRHLDLTRILPIVVPLQYELNKIPVGKDTPVIAVAEVGTNTSVVVGRVGGPLLLSRTILANLAQEPGRVGVEVNRSLLFAKQQFDCAVDRIWLMAESGQASEDLRAKCGTSRKITSLPTTPIDWLQTSIRLSAQQPVNLLAGYLRTKRRHALLRGTVLTIAWLGLVLFAASLFNSQVLWHAERDSMAALQARANSLRSLQQQLLARNATVAQNQTLIDKAATERLGPVPARLLAYIASVLPPNARLTDFTVRREPGTPGWSFRLDGQIEADEETARDSLTGMQNQLVRSPLRARFTEAVPLVLAAPATTNSATDIQKFSMEGVVLE